MNRWLLDRTVEPIARWMQARWGWNRLTLVSRTEAARAPIDFAAMCAVIFTLSDERLQAPGQLPPFSPKTQAILYVASLLFLFLRLNAAREIDQLATNANGSVGYATRLLGRWRRRDWVFLIPAMYGLMAFEISFLALVLFLGAQWLGFLVSATFLILFLGSVVGSGFWLHPDVDRAVPDPFPDAI